MRFILRIIVDLSLLLHVATIISGSEATISSITLIKFMRHTPPFPDSPTYIMRLIPHPF